MTTAPRKKTATSTQLDLLTPTSDWKRLPELPTLASQKCIAIDLETKDVGLINDVGPGWAHNNGYITGVSVAWDGGAAYLPVAHPGSDCFPMEAVRNWVRKMFDEKTIIFHNAPYDLGWLRVAWDIPPPQYLHDTIAMAVMIDENRFSYALDRLCEWQGIVGKDEAALREAAASFGFHGKDVKHNMWQLPARYVGPYAEADARATLALFAKLMPQLREQDVWGAYQTEIGLIPLCLQMRRRGIRIDEDAAFGAKKILEVKCDEQLQKISAHFKKPISLTEIRQTAWLESVHDLENISYPRTPKTDRGSFQGGKGGWMRNHSHWLPRTIAAAERYADAANKFVDGFVLKHLHNGRLHASINQFRNEEGGTRSHRFSYSDPPLQQMPERDDEIAPLIRGLFLPEEGSLWGAHDYSQQEYRIIVHAGYILKKSKADEAVRMYHDNPKTDFHGLVVEWTGLERRSAKDVNFAKAFGAGVKKFSQMIGRDMDEAEEIYRQYDQHLPFVSQAAQTCQGLAEKRGFIKLIDGARSHFDFWLPVRTSNDQPRIEKMNPHREDSEQYQKWKEQGFIKFKRGWGHKAFNRYVQGSAARQTKLAMLACWREGLVPMLQMHDDLNFSHESEAEGVHVATIMREIVQLAVPMQVDSGYGVNWGAATDSWAAALRA